MKLPESFGNVVGELPVGGRLPDGQEFPSGTLRPVRDGFVERNDVKSPYAATYLAKTYGLHYAGYYLSSAAILSLAGLLATRETKDAIL